MPLAEHTWLKYPAGSGHFYVEHRHGGIPENEQLYGPIEGDPFETLKLEELFRERLKPRATEGDPHYRLRLMFRTGEPGLIRRAARLIEPELARAFSRDEEGLYRRLALLETVREALRKEAAAFRKPQLQDVAERLRRVVSAAEAKIDEINDAVPDDGYQSATYLQRKLAAKIPAALWGRPLDGLRLGLVPRSGLRAWTGTSCRSIRRCQRPSRCGRATSFAINLSSKTSATARSKSAAFCPARKSNGRWRCSTAKANASKSSHCTPRSHISAATGG